MDRRYITVTVELGGEDAALLEQYHEHLRQLVRRWRAGLRYAEVQIAYQDEAQLDQDAQVDAYAVDDEGLGHVLDDGGVCVPGCPGCRG